MNLLLIRRYGSRIGKLLPNPGCYANRICLDGTSLISGTLEINPSDVSGQIGFSDAGAICVGARKLDVSYRGEENPAGHSTRIISEVTTHLSELQ